MQIIDITLPLSPNIPIWRGTPPYSLSKSSSIAEGKRTNDSVLYMGLHTGTHVDAPNHCLDGTANVDSLCLADCMGEASVVEFLNCSQITAAMLATIPPHFLKPRLLLKTDNSARWQTEGNQFYENFTAITPDAAQWIADHQIRLIGIDYLSIQLFADKDMQTHWTLLDKSIVILEGLDLTNATTGIYDLICLPLLIKGAEAAPARAVLVKK